VVELKYFAGMTLDETADVLGISRETVKRDWQIARAWLRQRLA
jgi:RNA polymerase sigma factor (sigma-70 family)